MALTLLVIRTPFVSRCDEHAAHLRGTVGGHVFAVAPTCVSLLGASLFGLPQFGGDR